MQNPHDREQLDLVLEALANKHRREIINLLSLQPHAIHQLAERRALSLPAIHKHIKVLERAGLVKRKKIGRTNILTLNRSSLHALQEWLNSFHTWWGSDDETLENYTAFLNVDAKDEP